MSARTTPVAIAVVALAACATAPAPLAPPLTAPRSAANAAPKRPAKPPPPASARPALPAPATASARGPIGGAGPVVVEAAASDASWVALCAAGTDTDGNGKLAVSVGPRGQLGGDALTSSLVIGDGPAEPIDELAAYDGSGRWLVVEKARKFMLVDARSRTESALESADTRDDATPYAPHRAVSFDAAGSRLMWVRRTTANSEVVVRDLATGSESRIDPGPGKIWRAELSPDGQLVVLRMIVDDTSGNGKLGWPVPETKRNTWRCHGPLPTYNAWLDRGDTPVVKVAPASGGIARAIPGFVAPFGAAVLERDSNNRLLLDRGTGTPIELADEKCGARVLHADASRGLLVAACSGAKLRAPVELLGEGLRQSTGFELAAASSDAWPAADPARLFALYPGADTALVDLDQRRVELLSRGDRVVAAWGKRALLLRGRTLLVFDADTRRATPLAGSADTDPVIRQTAAIVAVAPLVVDLAVPRVLGHVDHDPLAVAPDGRVLLAEGGDADATRLATGPLRWTAPLAQPAAPASAPQR